VKNPTGLLFPSTPRLTCLIDNPIAELNPGDMFGEMTCMSYYPRSATVRARTDCVMLEMCAMCLTSCSATNLPAQLERNYRARRLDSHLRSVPSLNR